MNPDVDAVVDVLATPGALPDVDVDALQVPLPDDSLMSVLGVNAFPNAVGSTPDAAALMITRSTGPPQVSIISDIEDFFKSYLVDTPEGFFRIFQSFTYGEMVISFLLLVLVMLFGFKWIWEVLR